MSSFFWLICWPCCLIYFLLLMDHWYMIGIWFCSDVPVTVMSSSMSLQRYRVLLMAGVIMTGAFNTICKGNPTTRTLPHTNCDDTVVCVDNRCWESFNISRHRWCCCQVQEAMDTNCIYVPWWNDGTIVITRSSSTPSIIRHSSSHIWLLCTGITI